MNEVMKFQAIETNAGVLILAVFDEADVCTYLHAGYEYSKGQLIDDIEALKNEEDPCDWENNAEDLQAEYDDLTSGEYGWEIVATNNGIYPERMGGAAALEFGVDKDELD